MWVWSLPGSRRFRFCRLRTNSPAPTSSTSDSATCETTSALPSPGPPRACRALGEIPLASQRHVETRGSNGRRAAEQQAGQRGHHCGERQDADVGRNIEHDRAPARRRIRDQRLRRPVRQRDAASAGEAGQHQRLNQDLSNQPRASRAEGQPQGEFRSAPGRPSQDEIPRVRACDEQDDADDAHEDEEGRRELTPKIRETGRRRGHHQFDGFPLARELVPGPPVGLLRQYVEPRGRLRR